MNSNTTQQTTANLSDKEICSDLLMTEKYVSGAYDTAIFEFKDTEVRDVLNHIQKDSSIFRRYSIPVVAMRCMLRSVNGEIRSSRRLITWHIRMSIQTIILCNKYRKPA